MNQSAAPAAGSAIAGCPLGAGVELLRRNLPVGSVTGSVLATEQTVTGYQQFTLPASSLLVGVDKTNVIAVAVHQSDPASTGVAQPWCPQPPPVSFPQTPSPPGPPPPQARKNTKVFACVRRA